MKEIKDVASSILVHIVTAYSDEEVEVDALRSGARYYLEKLSRKDILAGPDAPELPGTQSSAVSLSQYLKILQTVRFIKSTTEPISGETRMFPSSFPEYSRSDRSVLSRLSEQPKNHEGQVPSTHKRSERYRNRRPPLYLPTQLAAAQFNKADLPYAIFIQKPALISASKAFFA